MKTIKFSVLGILSFLVLSCSNAGKEKNASALQSSYQDVPYLQDYSIKYDLADSIGISKVYMDRNNVIQILSSQGILRTHDGQFLFPGTLIKDRTYRPITDKQISGLTLYQDQFVYLDDKAVLSNAWAGNLYLEHGLPEAHILAGGSNFDFMISDGKSLQFLSVDKG